MIASRARATLGPPTPFFIVRELAPAIAFYRDRLGFEVTLPRLFRAGSRRLHVVLRPCALTRRERGVRALPRSPNRAQWRACERFASSVARAPAPVLGISRSHGRSVARSPRVGGASCTAARK